MQCLTECSLKCFFELSEASSSSDSNSIYLLFFRLVIIVFLVLYRVVLALTPWESHIYNANYLNLYSNCCNYVYINIHSRICATSLAWCSAVPFLIFQ